MATPRADVYTATSGAAIYAGIVPVLALADGYERSSADLSLSSIAGAGDSAVITIRPRLQGVLWLEPSVRVDGVLGKAPAFKFTNHSIAVGGYAAFAQRAWQSSRRPMFSYDMVNWTYFDNQTLSGTDINFQHGTPFTGNTVYISRSRQMSVHGAGNWLAALATLYPSIVAPTPAAVTYTPSGAVADYAAWAFIADEFSAQTDDYGRVVPITPFYAAKISNAALPRPGGGAKALAMVTSGVHAGEDCGNDTMKAFITKLLDGSANSNFILSRFDVLLYPMMNAPGRAGGGWRGCWVAASNGEKDLNRAYNLTPAGLETVDKTKTVINADRSSVMPKWVIDFHGSYLQENWGLYVNTTNDGLFRSKLATISGQTIRDDGVLTDASFSRYWANSGAQLSIAHETSTDAPVSNAEVAAHAGHLMAALVSMINDGYITP